MTKIKKITAVNMAAIILTASLTACGSNDVENIPDEQDVLENAVSETPDEPLPEPETCEDYMKLADTYLQMDDVMQALVVLDEGIEKLNAGEQGVEEQEIDLPSQRKEYILAGMVAVGTYSTTKRYDDDGNTLYEYVQEWDKNGNRISVTNVYYNEVGEISYLSEHQYDGNGKQTERKYINYDSDGNITNCSHEAWVYDENGKEIENISYDENGNIKEKTKYEYDANGKNIGETDYDKDDKIVRQVEIEYDAAGREIKWECYDEYGRCSIQRIYTYDERGKLIQYDEYFHGRTEKEEYKRDENGNTIKSVLYDNDGNITNIYEFEYDEMGREIKIILYNGDGTVNYA